MRKQVSFAESQRNHRLQQDEALQRCFGMDASKMALKDPSVNLNNGLKINRPAIARCDSQHQHVMTIKIAKSLSAGPHLKHAALSPAQKKYLCSVAASHSPARVRQLITQHYMNVLYRCIPADGSPEREELVESSDKRDKHPPEVQLRVKHRKKIKSGAKNSGRSCHPKTSNQNSRIRLLDEEEEEGPEDFLSDCFSSLSMEGWEDDTFSDL
ncbi:hypothetical protein CesoFtcFv8_017632 [Champsocephalus esox]|uniref:Protein FAM216A n=1 Tax=Champsocephalus esox TaxID=159716 RepID=A0AAN8BKI8_9TELE|nr:hypothetical protein CesoFtcFv8_017632 [Champsocephalus esox]